MKTQVIVERKTFDKSNVADVLRDDKINVGFELEFDAIVDEPEPEPQDVQDPDDPWADPPEEDYYPMEVEQLTMRDIERLLRDIHIYPRTFDSPESYKPENTASDDEDDQPYPMYLNEIGLDELESQFDPVQSEFYGGTEVEVYDRLRKLFHAGFHTSNQDLTGEFEGNPNSAQDVFSFLADQFDIPTLAASLQLYPKAGWFGPKLKWMNPHNYEPGAQQEKFAVALSSLDITNDDAVNNFVTSLGKVTGIYDATWEPEEDDGEATVDEAYKDWTLTTDGSIGKHGYELVSPVLPITDALKEIETLFDWINENGFRTTAKTGFHVSMSYGSKRTTQKADYLKLGILLDEPAILNDWGRVGNTFTVPQIKYIKGLITDELKTSVRSKGLDVVIEKLKSMFNHDKYTAINVSKFDAHGYFEFRIMGGEGYHNQFDKVRKTILKYAICLKAALDPESFRKEYLTKLYKLLDQQTPISAERTGVIASDLLAKGFHTVSENPEKVVDLYKQYKEDAEEYKASHDPAALKRAADTLIYMMVFGTGQRKATSG